MFSSQYSLWIKIIYNLIWTVGIIKSVYIWVPPYTSSFIRVYTFSTLISTVVNLWEPIPSSPFLDWIMEYRNIKCVVCVCGVCVRVYVCLCLCTLKFVWFPNLCKQTLTVKHPILVNKNAKVYRIGFKIFYFGILIKFLVPPQKEKENIRSLPL